MAISCPQLCDAKHNNKSKTPSARYRGYSTHALLPLYYNIMNVPSPKFRYTTNPIRQPYELRSA